MLLLSILCDAKPQLPSITDEYLPAIFNRSENIYGYESKGLIRNLDQTDWATLYEIFGVC